MEQTWNGEPRKVCEICIMCPDGTPWSGYRYAYAFDATGNPVEQNKNGLVHSNSFNNLNQNVASVPGGTLTVLGKANYAAGTATVNNVQAQMAPDGTFAVPGVPFQLGTNTLNWAFTDAFGRSTNRTSSVVVTEKAYAYDANGNLTNDTRFAYEWDCENRLAAVRDAATGALVQSNRYDALWRRREKIDYAADGTATTNRYIYKDWLVLAVIDGEGNVLETYTHGADLSGEVGGSAGGIGGILASTQAGGATFYAYDFNGNIVGVTDSSGVVVSSLTYTPFGEVLVRTGPFTPRYQFSTKEYSPRTGLNYYGYRYYSPNLGRWISRDPIQEFSSSLSMTIDAGHSFIQDGDESMLLHAYAFVDGNSISEIDFLGLSNVWELDCGKCKVCVDRNRSGDRQSQYHIHWKCGRHRPQTCRGGGSAYWPSGNPREHSGPVPGNIRKCLEKTRWKLAPVEADIADETGCCHKESGYNIVSADVGKVAGIAIGMYLVYKIAEFCIGGTIGFFVAGPPGSMGGVLLLVSP